MSKVLAGLFFAALALVPLPSAAAVRTVHVYVALCDNQSQGIVPVPEKLGNGDDPANNLYWGALYGVKTHFKKSADWKLVESIKDPSDGVLERVVFRHKGGKAFMVADAYRGREIRRAVEDFLGSAAGKNQEEIELSIEGKKQKLKIGGGAGLVAYIGHNGLMDFSISAYPANADGATRDAIVLACLSKSYFTDAIKKAGANPLLWTTGLMAPEAYTLKAALDGWLLNEDGDKVRRRAAAAYDKYQKCGLKAALRLLVTGW